MPDKTDADADTSGFRVAEEEIGARVADEIDVTDIRRAEEDSSRIGRCCRCSRC